MTELLEGGCHCGTIRYRYHSPLSIGEIPVRACGCSFCLRIRGRYTSHPEGRLAARIADEQALSDYRFGPSTADFVICRRCGGMPFVISRIDDRLYAVLNINSLDGDPLGMGQPAIADFDGEAVADRLDRRKSKWIGTVEINYENIK